MRGASTGHGNRHDRPGVAAEEARLLESAAGDPSAFAPIYENYLPRVYRYCLRRLGTREQAEDATTFSVHSCPDRVRGYRGGSVAAWLFQIAHHTVADELRGRRPACSLESPALGEPATSQMGVLDRLVPEEQLHEVARLLATLPADQRELIALKAAGELTAREIGVVLGKSEGAVRVALHRTIQQLRTALHAAEETWMSEVDAAELTDAFFDVLAVDPEADAPHGLAADADLARSIVLLERVQDEPDAQTAAGIWSRVLESIGTAPRANTCQLKALPAEQGRVAATGARKRLLGQRFWLARAAAIVLIALLGGTALLSVSPGAQAQARRLACLVPNLGVRACDNSGLVSMQAVTASSDELTAQVLGLQASADGTLVRMRLSGIPVLAAGFFGSGTISVHSEGDSVHDSGAGAAEPVTATEVSCCPPCGVRPEQVPSWQLVMPAAACRSRLHGISLDWPRVGGQALG